jgi:hypothetical protein
MKNVVTRMQNIAQLIQERAGTKEESKKERHKYKDDRG